MTFLSCAGNVLGGERDSVVAGLIPASPNFVRHRKKIESSREARHDRR